MASPEPLIPQTLTTADVMAVLRLKDPDTVYALRRAGKIRGARVGRLWRYDAASVAAFARGEPAPQIGAPAAPKKKPAAAPPAWAAGVESIIGRT